MPTETFERKEVKQESFNAHFAEANHNGEKDWEVRLIDQNDNLRKRESFWQHELETFQPNGLNECKVALFDIYLSSFFVILTHNIYCKRWQRHVRLYV